LTFLLVPGSIIEVSAGDTAGGAKQGVIIMPKQKRFKTDYKGVYYIEVERLDKPGTEKMYYYYFRDDTGKQREEKAGRQYGKERMGAKKASLLRADRMRGIIKSKREIKAEEEDLKIAKASRPTFKYLWKEYSQTLGKSLAADKSRFENHLKDIHDKTPGELITLDVERIKNRLKKDKLAPQTIKHCLVLIDRIVNHGLDQEPPLCKPLSFRIKKPSFDNMVTEILTDTQLQSLLKTIEADLRRDPFTGRAMLLALSTGMRRGELLNLRWNDIDFNFDFITLKNTKSGKTHKIPLNESAKKVFNDIPRTSSPFVFPGEKGGKRSDFNRGARRIRKAAGLPLNFRPFHGLRHHYASTLASSGQVDIYTLQKLLTHADPSTTQRYAHLRDDRLKAGAAVADNLIKRITDEQKVINFAKD